MFKVHVPIDPVIDRTPSSQFPIQEAEKLLFPSSDGDVIYRLFPRKEGHVRELLQAHKNLPLHAPPNPTSGSRYSRVLQHSLEEKHPLNSTRILRLGLTNVTVASVSDVNFGARICIDCSPGFSGEGLDFDVQDAEIRPTQKLGEGLDVERSKLSGIEPIKAVESCGVRDGREQVMDMGMAKKGAVRSIKHVWMSTDCETKKTDLREVLESRSAGDALAKGFLVRKLQKRQVGLVVGRLDEFEEFRLEVPSGSLLLFPSEEALTVAEIKETDVKVKNLIVLDGAWMKARRMYSENPWLRFLPHLKLDLDTTSLYRQPKEGYLSTIESVIYAMNALGDYTKGLSKLLTAFEVMVDD